MEFTEVVGPSITSTFKGLTRIRPLSCGFDSSVGRALHWHRRGRGFESRPEPEFFSGLCSSSVTAALALMTVITKNHVIPKELAINRGYRLFTSIKSIFRSVIVFLDVIVNQVGSQHELITSEQQEQKG